MLIASDRHKPDDLELWRELEAADLVHSETHGFRRKVDRSINALQEFVAGGPCYVSTSWGKDSVATLGLLRESGLHSVSAGHLLVANSANPHCSDVRDAFLSSYMINYAEIAVDYSSVDRALIDGDYDKATDVLWRDGFLKMENAIGADRHISGIRGDESFGRLMRCARWGESTERTCAPLSWWTAEDVFAFLASRSLPVHPNYAMLGGGRWKRRHVRTAEIGDSHGRRMGREDWEREYYGDILRRLDAKLL